MRMKPSDEHAAGTRLLSSRLIASSVMSIACLAPAYGADAIGSSGYELSLGSESGDVVRGVLFAGGTHAPCDCFTTDVNGTWIARIDRTAGGGIGVVPPRIWGTLQ